jgi:hypothetical protein
VGNGGLNWNDRPIGSFDWETALFRPGLQAPPPVVLSWCVPDLGEVGIAPSFATPLRELLRSGVRWAGVNIGFDMAVAVAWGVITPQELFDAYDQNLIIDLGIFERVAEIGGWTPRKVLSLEVMATYYGLPKPDKGDVRISFEPLLGTDLSAYTPEQIRYSLDDSVLGAKLFKRQIQRFDGRVHVNDVAELTRDAFRLYLTRAWGIGTDHTRVHILEEETEAAIKELEIVAKQAGFVRENGKQNQKVVRDWVYAAYEGDPPMTRPNKNRKSKKPFVPQVKIDKETLVQSGNPILEALADYGSWRSIRSGDLKFLLNGIKAPIHTKFGLADTTRTTSSKPNLQNIRRATRKDCTSCGRSSPAYVKSCPHCGQNDWRQRQGIRECFIPPDGCCFVAIDHSGLELVTLAQCCVWMLGRRNMANFINEHGASALHDQIGAEIVGCSFQEGLERKRAGDKEFKNARNCAKVVNFGRPGGLSAPTLVLYAKTAYGIEISLQFAEYLIDLWERINPDGAAYLKNIRNFQRGRRFDVTIPGTTIQRNQITYCSAANDGFQGLGARIEGAVGYEIAKEILLRNFPARVCNFIHDEFIFVAPIGTQTYVAKRAYEIMTGPTVQRFLPDVKIDAEFAAMDRWSKSAEAIWENGELQVCQI